MNLSSQLINHINLYITETPATELHNESGTKIYHSYPNLHHEDDKDSEDANYFISDNLSFLLVPSYFWDNKNLFLFPLELTFAIWQCKNHFDNKNDMWGLLTALFILLPNLVTSILTLIREKRFMKAIRYLLFFPVATFYE